MQGLTFPQRRARERGLDARAIVRKMNVGRRLSEREIDNRAVTVTRVLKQGNCGALYARRLGHVLNLEGAWLELPCKCWPAAWRAASQSAVETPKAPRGASFPAARAQALAEGARCNARPVFSPDPSRIPVLRLVPLSP